MIFAAERLWTDPAPVVVRFGVRALVAAQRVGPFEGLSTLAAHVLPLAGVAVHVAGQVFFDTGRVVAQRALQLTRADLGFACTF